MKVLVAIDDTDNLETRGTGHLAEEIAQDVVSNGWGTRTFVTRHQLFVHPDVPYTSHNSTMCFTAEVDAGSLARLISSAAASLERESAPGSDPGLCVAVAERLRDVETLVSWGRRAKREVLTQDEARGLAERLGVHLSSHGGTGQGIIGALAGVGLRLQGSDGRLRGHLDTAALDDTAAAGEVRAHLGLDVVRSPEGRVVRDDEHIQLDGERLKAVLLEGKVTLLVMPNQDTDRGAAPWRPCPRDFVKTY